MRIVVLLAFAAALGTAEDARDIVRRSVNRDEHNARLARNYTFLERVETRELDDRGRVKKRESQTFDVTLLEGSPYRRRIERDDRPLPAKEEQKEQQRLAKSIAQRQKESEAERARRLAEWEKKRERQRETLREVPEAFDFRLVGEERLEGRDVWVIEATPRAGYQGKTRIARYFPKLKGKFWIDRQDYQWVKAEAEVQEPLSIGLILARVAAGTRLMIEQSWVNDEVWLPKRMAVNASARVALLKKFRGEAEITYTNYRKFQTDSRVIPGEVR